MAVLNLMMASDNAAILVFGCSATSARDTRLQMGKITPVNVCEIKRMQGQAVSRQRRQVGTRPVQTLEFCRQVQGAAEAVLFYKTGI